MPISLPGSFQSLDDYTTAICDLVNSPLVRQITGGIHVNDALIYNAWDALPPDWTAWWSSIPDHRLAQHHLIDSIDETPTTVPIRSDIGAPPDSLTQWLAQLRSASLSRAQRAGPCIELPPELAAQMNTKKKAEVSVAAAYIRQVCTERNITSAIDIGSGQGYLSVALAHLFPELRVLAIDGSESQIAASKSFASTLGVPADRLTHLVRYVDRKTRALADEMAAWADGQKCILVGLHACGQLSEHMLRYFAQLPFVDSLGAVGCCYNHIVPRSADCPDGFPISGRLRNREVSLSATALMTGCQAPNNWERTDLSSPDSTFSNRRLYRAIFEKLLHDKGIDVSAKSRTPWGIRKGDTASFATFARRAMHSLGIDDGAVSDAELAEYDERYRGCKGQIAILWTLSVLCCKLVESAIALDRYSYLVEQDARHVDVVPVFDYRVSPRNLMMVARKESGSPG
ncbi:RNA small subunit methyltransferase [Apiospora kogelbergensis]|uniref:RNA small subunit methyltransferase n=1 Tax=Apiospora kogelbergensis TaxID=1337665 RepID=UPI003131CB32